MPHYFPNSPHFLLSQQFMIYGYQRHFLQMNISHSSSVSIEQRRLGYNFGLKTFCEITIELGGTCLPGLAVGSVPPCHFSIVYMFKLNKYTCEFLTCNQSFENYKTIQWQPCWCQFQ